MKHQKLKKHCNRNEECPYWAQQQTAQSLKINELKDISIEISQTEI